MATVRAELRTFQWLARHYDGFILDQYGVLHNGGDPLPGALACLRAAASAPAPDVGSEEGLDTNLRMIITSKQTMFFVQLQGVEVC